MKKGTVEDPACPKWGGAGGKGNGGRSSVPKQGGVVEKGNGGRSSVPEVGWSR
ncbi:hypothetical protein [Mesobacillus maritimus]|uniref:Uncharacterized protein n=1 Tax=Mesobacillus maritimus TaxID=1643336 RepID=A0ABS7K5E4_9BACI|nr:hypothetical protein [Mesobacillus maritimus]MBY0097435.1 hypothetical protein [Mesobacillus maritimus]